MGAWMLDFRYAWRMLLKKPAFTAVIVITLALGIGANTAIFSVTSGVLLKPLPYENPEELLVIDESVHPEGWRKPCHAVTLPELEEFEKQTEVLAAAGGHQESVCTMTGAGAPLRLDAAYVTSGFFRALSVRPETGRLFTSEDDEIGAGKVAVISRGLWHNAFGDAPDVAGQTVFLNKAAHTIVGVLPAGFKCPLGNADIYTPLPNDQGQYHEQRWRVLTVICRLRPNVGAGEAQARFDLLAERFAREDPQSCGACKIELKSLHEQVVGDSGELLGLLLGAAAVVLLIACVNVANLLLARGAQRTKEFALRAALGAGRFKLLRQALAESALLGVVGGSLGLLAAVWGKDLLTALLPDEVPRTDEIGIDWRVLSFALAVSILTGLLVGLPAALKSLRLDLHSSLKDSGGRVGAAPGRGRMQKGLVVSELALATILLVGAGLLLNSFHRLMNVNPGFEPENVLTFRMHLHGEVEKRNALCEEMLERLAALPGVRSAGVCDGAPLAPHGWWTSFKILDGPTLDADARPSAALSPINPDYFRTVGIPLLAGRILNERDTRESKGAVVINEAMAERFLPGENPIGKQIKVGATVGEGYPNTYEIVGVAGSIHGKALDADQSPRIYVPFAQHPRGYASFFIRCDDDPTNLVAAARSTSTTVAPDQAPYAFATLTQLISDSVASRRFPMILIGIFAGLALLLAAIGIYGVLSYTVSQRTHEFGIRAALGARAGDVRRLVLRQAFALALFGACLGLAAACAAAKLISSQLYEVKTIDPATYLGAAAFLILLALAASCPPAYRAMKIDPITALRCE